MVFDIDFRPDQWHDPRAFGVMARAILPLVDIVLGTDDEINAAMLSDPAQITLTHSQVSDTKVAGDVDTGIARLLALGPKALVQKRGVHGARTHLKRDDGSIEQIDSPGYPVEVYNILGAGDAFAAGFICGVSGAWTGGRRTTRCSLRRHRRDQARLANFMPTWDEVMAFVNSRGGL